MKIWYLLERKSIRRSTAAKSAATLQRLKERTEEGRRRRGRRARAQDEWRPTQEELLEEAKITEQENLKSLGKCT
jgi:vacuolar protein sorting-associated protein 72